MTQAKPIAFSTNIDATTFQQLLSYYPNTLESFYRVKIKGDEKKRKQALDDDLWRYQELAVKLQQRKKDKGLSKDELERLVQWKITHQTNRPFLLPQIRKNEQRVVEQCTADAHKLLFASKSSSTSSSNHCPSREDIRQALDKVCELKGVGPATGTLILSVYDGQNIPFFEDELYAWLFPDFNGKLRYNVKEYFDLLQKFQEINKQSLKIESSPIKLAEAYEKIAFVCEHWNHVDEGQKMSLKRDPGSNKDEMLSDMKMKDDSHQRSNEQQDLKASARPVIAKKRKGTPDEEQVKSNKILQKHTELEHPAWSPPINTVTSFGRGREV